MSEENTWESVDLYGPDVRVWRESATGRFRVRVAGAGPRDADGDAPRDVDLVLDGDNARVLDALLLVLADVKRDLTGEDFVPGKTMAAPRRGTPGDVTVRLEPEDVEYLRTRVRVGKEDSLDGALGNAVKAYMRDLLRRGHGEEPDDEPEAEAPRRVRPRQPPREQQTLGKPRSLTGLGTKQLHLLQTARKKGYLTRLDVARAYGISARRGGAAGARTRTESHLNALVARRLVAFEPRPSGEPAWALTELGRVALEEWDG